MLPYLWISPDHLSLITAHPTLVICGILIGMIDQPTDHSSKHKALTKRVQNALKANSGAKFCPRAFAAFKSEELIIDNKGGS